MRKQRPSHLLLALIVVSTGFGAPALAATRTSVSDGTWSDGAIWSGGVAPVAGDDVVILHNVSLTTGAEIADLDVQAGTLTHGAVTLIVTGDFSLTGGVYTAQANSEVAFEGAALQTVTGSPTFQRLTVENTAPTPNDANAVVFADAVTALSRFSVQLGQANVATGSSFGWVTLSGGVMKPAAGALITVTANDGTSLALDAGGGTLIHNNSTFRFTGTVEQFIDEATLYNVEGASTAAVPSSSNDVYIGNGTIVENLVLVSDGQLTIAGEVNDVEVDADGILGLATNAKIAGDLDNSAGGTIAAETNSYIILNGAGPQLISGSVTLQGLGIDNTALVGDSNAVTTTGNLTVLQTFNLLSGQFSPTTGDSFRNMSLSGGLLKPASGATIVLTGSGAGTAFNATDESYFEANSSTFRLTGSGEQGVFGGVFYDVEVAGTAAVPGDTNDVQIGGGTTVANELRVEDGQVFISGQVHDVIVSADGIAKFSNTGNISGDLTNTLGGSVIATPTAFTTFNGTSAQLISGPCTLQGMSISNTGGTGDANAVSTTGGLTTLGGINVPDGQFSPNTGDRLRSISAFGGLLKPAAGSTIEITGASGGTAVSIAGGALDANGSTFRFTASGAQGLAGGTYYNITVANTAATPDDTNDVALAGNVTVSNLVTVEDGQFFVGGQVHDVTVLADGICKFGLNPFINGDLTNTAGGSVIAQSGSYLSFNGTGRQLVSGPATLTTAAISNTATTPSDTDCVTTTGELVVTGNVNVFTGQFSPGSGDRYGSFVLLGTSLVKPVANATITLTGSPSINAISSTSTSSFQANGSTFIFAAPTPETSVYTVFHNVEVASTATTPSDGNRLLLGFGSQVTGTLLVTRGFALVEGTINNIQIEPDGTLTFGASAVTLTGELINSGTLQTGSGSVTFDGGAVQTFETVTPVTFPSTTVTTGTIVNEVGPASSSATSLALFGTARRTWSGIADSQLTGGLTGVTVDIASTGTLANLSVDRIGTVPNADPAIAPGASWTFNDNGATGYSVGVTLPHSLATPANASVARYAGFGAAWISVQDSFTANSVTRGGVTDLSSVWAVAEAILVNVEDWQTVGDE